MSLLSALKEGVVRNTAQAITWAIVRTFWGLKWLLESFMVFLPNPFRKTALS
jgi:hypothetical protein